MKKAINIRPIDTFDGGNNGLYPCRIELRQTLRTHGLVLVLFSTKSGAIDFNGFRSFKNGVVKPLSIGECGVTAARWKTEFSAAWDTLRNGKRQEKPAMGLLDVGSQSA